MSTHRIDVVRIRKVTKHPNADALDIIPIEGFTAIAKLGQFKVGDLAVYIEPDYVVPDTEQFAFLAGKFRIKAKRLRGVWSQGLLIEAPPGVREGEDLMKRLGIVRYEPQIKTSKGTFSSGTGEKTHPSLVGLPVYDLENWRRYRSVFEEGERVLAFEKIHGANGKFSYRGGRMRVGSRTMWKRNSERTWREKLENSVRTAVVKALPFLRKHWRTRSLDFDKDDIWWKALKSNPWIETFCRANPHYVLFGEVFGQVQDLKYGAGPEEVFFRAFDIFHNGVFLDADEFVRLLPSEQRVPLLYDGPHDAAVLEELSRQDSVLANHLSEGIVIKPVRNRYHPKCGRVALKLVSDRYLERS